MTQLSIIKKKLIQTVGAISKAETDQQLFKPFSESGDDAAQKLIDESIANACESILDLYKELEKHAPTIETLSNGK